METQITHSENKHYTLKKALFIYQHNGWSNQEMVVTEHDVTLVNDKPTLLSGRYITRNFMQALLANLQEKHTSLALLPEQVLAHDRHTLVWWEKAHPRVMFFQNNDPMLQKLNGMQIPQPPLVFVAKRGQLQVFALAQNARPELHTELHGAPYMNMLDKNRMCVGSARLPRGVQLSTMAQWSDAFFHSAFTLGKVPVQWGGTYGELLRKAIDDNAFPVTTLKPLDQTLGDLLKELS